MGKKIRVAVFVRKNKIINESSCTSDTRRDSRIM